MQTLPQLEELHCGFVWCGLINKWHGEEGVEKEEEEKEDRFLAAEEVGMQLL